MKADERGPFEERIYRLAESFRYPPTPDVRLGVRAELEGRGRSSQVWSRARWAVAAVLAVTVITVSLVPAARASLREVVRIGAVRLMFGPSREPTPIESAGVRSEEIDLAGETTLGEARRRFPESILLPTYPADLGTPDRVFLQDAQSGVALVWLDGRGRVRLALFELTSDAVYRKLQPEVVDQTIVAGQPALWTKGPYVVEVQDRGLTERRLIDGHVLIWTESELTFRLETDLSLEEARRVAESLRP